MINVHIARRIQATHVESVNIRIFVRCTERERLEEKEKGIKYKVSVKYSTLIYEFGPVGVAFERWSK